MIAADACLLAIPAYGESVDVKYRGPADLAPFSCTDITRSARGIYYHYCEIDAATVARLLSADSIGRFYNANIKGDGWDGPFDCRTRRVPAR